MAENSSPQTRHPGPVTRLVRTLAILVTGGGAGLLAAAIGDHHPATIAWTSALIAAGLGLLILIRVRYGTTSPSHGRNTRPAAIRGLIIATVFAALGCTEIVVWESWTPSVGQAAVVRRWRAAAGYAACGSDRV